MYCLLGTSVLLSAQNTEKPERTSSYWSVQDQLESAIGHDGALPADRIDTSGDGQVDYILIESSDGKKLFEIMDYDRNGVMDDFCVYEKGILVRRIIDSNSDGMLDVWIYIKDGSYIEEYQRDSDFDGSIDLIKQFGEDE
jgi:hypothetical protein